jgi:outer membrane protein, multidrug efflux system
MKIKFLYKYLFISLMIFCIFFSFSCLRIGPKYQRPDLPIPCCFKNATATQHSGATWERWWDIFNDPCLTSLIETAVEKNFDLKITQAKIKEAQAKYQMAQSVLFPSGAFIFNNARVNASLDLPVNVPSLNYNSHLLGFNALWEPDILGFGSEVVKGAKRAQESVVEKHRDATMILISEIGRAYFSLRAVQEQKKIFEESLGVICDLIYLSKIQFQHALIGSSEIALLEKNYHTTQKTVLTMQETEASLLNSLSFLIGELPHFLHKKLSNCYSLPNLSDTLPPTGLPSELLCRRPDVRQAEKLLMQATHEISGALLPFFPNLNLLTNGSFISFLLTDLFLNASRNALNNISLIWPIIQSGRLIGNYKVKRAEEAQAFYYYAKTLLGAFHDVENQLNAYRKEQDRFSQHDCVQKSVDKVLKNIHLLKKQGLASQKDFLQEKLQAIETKVQKVQSKSQMAIRLIALYKALGGGWEAFGESSNVSSKTPSITPT